MYSKANNYLVRYDFFKFIAIFVMILDHLGAYFFTDVEFLRVVGRLAAPLFLFLVGYSGSARFSKEILIYAILLQIFHIYDSEWQDFRFNILFMILLLRYLNNFVKLASFANFWVIYIFAIFYSVLVGFIFEYGLFGLLFALLGVFVKANIPKARLYLASGAVCLLYAVYEAILFEFSNEMIFLLLLLLSVLAISIVNISYFEKSCLQSRVIKLAAKYALLIYFYHKIAFMALT